MCPLNLRVHTSIDIDSCQLETSEDKMTPRNPTPGSVQRPVVSGV